MVGSIALCTFRHQTNHSKGKSKHKNKVVNCNSEVPPEGSAVSVVPGLRPALTATLQCASIQTMGSVCRAAVVAATSDVAS